MQQQSSPTRPIYTQPLALTRAERSIRTAAQRDATNELRDAWAALQRATRLHQNTSLQRARFNAAMDAVLPFAN